MKIDAPYGGALRIGLVAREVRVPDRNAYEKYGSTAAVFIPNSYRRIPALKTRAKSILLATLA